MYTVQYVVPSLYITKYKHICLVQQAHVNKRISFMCYDTHTVPEVIQNSEIFCNMNIFRETAENYEIMILLATLIINTLDFSLLLYTDWLAY